MTSPGLCLTKRQQTHLDFETHTLLAPSLLSMAQFLQYATFTTIPTLITQSVNQPVPLSPTAKPLIIIQKTAVNLPFMMTNPLLDHLSLKNPLFQFVILTMQQNHQQLQLHLLILSRQSTPNQLSTKLGQIQHKSNPISLQSYPQVQ